MVNLHHYRAKVKDKFRESFLSKSIGCHPIGNGGIKISLYHLIIKTKPVILQSLPSADVKQKDMARGRAL